MPTFAKIILAAMLFLCAPWACAELLDINTATAGQLADTLVGVGKARAEAIVQDREKNGRFKSVDDLERVSGIGPVLLEKNRDKMTVGDGAPTSASASPSPAAQTAAPAKPK